MTTARKPKYTEAHLQAAVAAMLVHMGYWPRTPDRIEAAPSPRGWYVHLAKPRGNPILLDVLLLGNDGRYLEFELKRGPRAPVSPEQRRLLEYPPPSYICYDIDEVLAVVGEWERGEECISGK